MRITDIFVRRPVLAIVVNLVIIIAGLQAIRTLNVRQYPKLESATITVRTVYVGADADLVRGFITTPLERAIAAADGIDYMESQSTQGLSTINVRLKLNFDAARALADVTARVNQVRADLPPEAEVPAINIEPSDSVLAAMYLSFGSDILEENQVTDYLIRVVQPRLSAIDGVQKADILGGRTFAIRAWLKPGRMAALGVSPAQVRAALAANNYLAAVGQTKGQLVQVNLSARTDLQSVDEFRKLVVKEQNGTLVRLQDVAEVVLGADTYDQEVRFSGQKAVFMGVWVLPNANSLDVIGRVNEEVKKIQKELPSGMRATIAFDSTKYINNAISEVTKTLVETVFIVMVVIFLFLGSLRTVLVPVVARFTGRLTCGEIAREASEEIGAPVPLEVVVRLADQLERGLFLEGATFSRARARAEREFAEATIRAASHAGGAYHSEPRALERYIDEACLAKARDAAEFPQQLLSGALAHSGDFGEGSAQPLAGAALAVESHGETVRFVANLLY